MQPKKQSRTTQFGTLPFEAIFEEAVNVARSADVAILAMGISRDISGETASRAGSTFLRGETMPKRRI